MKTRIQVTEDVSFDVNYTGAYAKIETKYMNVKASVDIEYWASYGEDVLRREILFRVQNLCLKSDEAIEKFMNEFHAIQLAFENEASLGKEERAQRETQNRKRTSKGRSLSGIIIESAVRHNLHSNKHHNESEYPPRDEYYNYSTESILKKIERMESKGNTYEDALAWYESECIELPQINDTEYDPETIALVTKYTLMVLGSYEYYGSDDWDVNNTGYNDFQIDTDKHPYAIYFGTHEDKQMYLDVTTYKLNRYIKRCNADRIADGRRVVKPLDLPKYQSDAEYAEMFSSESTLRRMKKTALVDMGGCIDNKIRTRYYDKSKPEYYRNIDIVIKAIADEYKKASPEKKKDINLAYEYASIGKAIRQKMRSV